MSEPFAKNPFADPELPTLQQVRDHILSDLISTPQAKREISSALNTVTGWLHQAAGDIPANHEYLRRRFERLNWGALGVTEARFRNVRSLVKRGLAIAGIPTSGRSYLRPLSPEWQALLDATPSPQDRQWLARMARFATGLGVDPSKVTDATLEAFHEALTTEDLTAKPDTAVQSAIRIWNRLVDQLPGWNLQRLTPILRRETYSLEEHRLPPAFLADLERHLDILAGTDPTHPLAPPRALKPLSLKTRRYQFIQIISALHQQGEDIHRIHGLADLCQPDRIRLALQFFFERERDRHGAEADVQTSMIHGIADAARAAAKHYVQAPVALVAELARIAGRLKPRFTGLSEKARVRLTQMDRPDAPRQLLLHPQAEMQKLAEKSAPSRRDAVRFSVLLAIEILNLAPMRLENLAELDLERHFLWPPKDRGDIGIVIYAVDEVKNRVPLEYRLTDGSAAAMRTYLKRFRPLLVGPEVSTALFPGRSGKPKRNDSLSKQIIALLKNELGITWHTHLFRHHAARTYLRAHPGDYETARRLLGHRRVETTMQNYEGMEMGPSVHRYDQLLHEKRGQTPFKAKPTRAGRGNHPAAGR